MLGFDIYKVASEDTYDAAGRVLEVGYRHIDTTRMYSNEVEVEATLEVSGIAREDLSIMTRVDNPSHEPSQAVTSIRRSLEGLRTNYMDLLFVRQPLPTLYGDDVALPWPTLEDALNADGVCAIGLSNYERGRIEAVHEVATATLHVLQVESHPLFPNTDLHTYAQGFGMVFETWSPLARRHAVTGPTLVETGAELGVGPAQITLRQALDRGHVVSPKALGRECMAASLDAFSFSLDPERTARINALDVGKSGRMGPYPATMDRL